MRLPLVTLIAGLGLAAPLHLQGAPLHLQGAPLAETRLSRVPLSFEEPVPGRFVSQAPGSALTIDRTGVRLDQAGRSILMRVAGVPGTAPVGEQRLAATVTHFSGPHERTSALYERVRYRQVYPGIDLVFYGHGGVLEYDFVVLPGADASAIRFEVEGARATLNADGSLALAAGKTSVRWNAPVLYERETGRAIQGAFAVEGGQVRFVCGGYDHTKTLIIDPTLDYVTYFGSTGNEHGFIATDNQGNFYLAGPTTSQDLKVTAGAYQTAFGGMTSSVFASDAYVAKFNAAGAIVWLTYVGGSGDDFPHAVAVDPAGNVYIAGFTNSRDFPTKNAAQPAFGGQGGVAIAPVGDAFVAKLDPTGSKLLYSTYLGGSLDDIAFAVAVDSLGNAYVGGSTLSRNFPVTAGVAQPAFGGAGGQEDFPKLGSPWFSTGDGFVAKFDPNGVLKWATYLGGSFDDVVNALTVDSNQNVYCGGFTLSYNFPVSSNAPQQKFAGVEQQNPFGNFGDGFVTKISADGTTLEYSTYLGGSGDESVQGIAVDSAGQAYVTGFSTSANFPTTPGAFQRVTKGRRFWRIIWI